MEGTTTTPSPAKSLRLDLSTHALLFAVLICRRGAILRHHPRKSAFRFVWGGGVPPTPHALASGVRVAPVPLRRRSCGACRPSLRLWHLLRMCACAATCSQAALRPVDLLWPVATLPRRHGSPVRLSRPVPAPVLLEALVCVRGRNHACVRACGVMGAHHVRMNACDDDGRVQDAAGE
jgi:hypothetical protein